MNSMFDDEICVGLEEQEIKLVRKNEFVPWFRHTILSNGNWDHAEYLECLAHGSHSIVRVYNGYMINGYRFQAQGHTRISATSNSGVSVKMDNNDDRDA